jgi:hypothetical protein
MKIFSRVAVISAALLSMVVGPGSAPAQPDQPRYNVYSYVYYSEPTLQNIVGYGTGYCDHGTESVALFSGQFSYYWTRDLIGWCNSNDELIYE